MTVRGQLKKNKDRGIKIMNLREGSALRPEREGMCLFPEKAKPQMQLSFCHILKVILTTVKGKKYIINT